MCVCMCVCVYAVCVCVCVLMILYEIIFTVIFRSLFLYTKVKVPSPDPIYPTPPLGQDMTQGQFFKRSLTGLNSEFSFS